MTNNKNEKRLDTLLAKFFSGSIICSLLEDHTSKNSLLSEFHHLVKQNNIAFEGKTYRDLFEFAFDYLSKNYRNEYIYKNAVAKNILLGRHSLNTSFMLQEFRVGGCKADILILNGTSNIYEIKSELDSLNRLCHQVTNYIKAFDMVHVITFPGQAKKIEAHVPECVGLMELNKKNSISVIREAKSGKAYISTSFLFDSLRKNEYQNIINKYYGVCPEVPNTKAYKVCKELFVKIPPEDAHDFAVAELKERGNIISLKNFISSAPDYFKSLSLNIYFSKKRNFSLEDLLNTSIYST